MTTLLRGITWDHPRGLDGLVATARAYAAIAPEVLVEWTTRPLQAFADQSVDALARRFDLLYLDHPWIGSAVCDEALVPLDEHLDVAFLVDQREHSVGRSFESYVLAGHIWALATDAAAQVAVFRRDLMDRVGLEPPRTWDDVLETAKALRRHDLWMAWPSIPVDAACSFFAVCRALGEAPFVDPDRVIGRATGGEALRVLRRLIGAVHPESSDLNPPRLMERMATADEIAYCPIAFGYSNYARPGFRRSILAFGPAPAGMNGAPRGTLGGAGLAVSAHGGAMEAACAYARFVAAPDVQRGIYFRAGGQPGHRAAWTDPDVNAASTGFFRDTLDSLDAAYLRPRHPGFVAFQDAAGERIRGWLTDGGRPDDVLDDLNEMYRRTAAGQAEGVRAT